MTRRNLRLLTALTIGCGLAACPVATTVAQQFGAAGRADRGLPRDRLREPVYRVAAAEADARSQPAAHATAQAAPAQAAPNEAAPNDATPNEAQPARSIPVQTVAAPAEHPLTPVLKMARDGLDRMDRTIADYECLMVKRERIDGKLGDYQYVHTKVRNKPFSIYMYFLAPDAVKGREAIYVDGQNDGKLIGHDSGFKGRLLKRVFLDPTSPLVMANQRYPITKAGIRNLTKELITVGEHDAQYGECEVKFFKDAKVQDRVCTCIQVVHPTPRKNFRFHLARIYIDDELQIPIRYESYDWPQKEGGSPVLLEEYTYMKLKLNVGLKDADFDPDNPNYNFQ